MYISAMMTGTIVFTDFQIIQITIKWGHRYIKQKPVPNKVLEQKIITNKQTNTEFLFWTC